VERLVKWIQVVLLVLLRVPLLFMEFLALWLAMLALLRMLSMMERLAKWSMVQPSVELPLPSMMERLV
jgi:hypothetical protein